jgi:omega-6 fatty acid desaturase (delta-12 desaturase)
VRPLAVFAVVLGLWFVSLAVGLWAEHWVLRAAMVVPLTLASGQLFMLAHDAGHRSYSTSAVVNGLVGRVGLVPSLHVFGLWRAHHDVHHRYTNLRGRDFVWTPLSVDEYTALPWWRRGLHRTYRHGSGLGLGLHYTVEIWAPRMVWPRAQRGVERRRRLMIDTILSYGAVVGLATAARGLVAWVDPDRVGDAGFWLSAVLLLVVMPVLGTHWLIGFVIYLNHTHPDIVWYDDEHEWARREVQLEGSTALRFSSLRHAVLPRRIMNHTAHHLDPAVPLRELDRAQHHLAERLDGRIVSYDWSLGQFRDVLSRCKLYDYHAHRWLTYAAAGDAR